VITVPPTNAWIPGGRARWPGGRMSVAGEFQGNGTIANRAAPTQTRSHAFIVMRRV